MPLVEQHPGSRPESCEVCRYLQLHPELDRMLIHTLTMLAGWALLEDLRASGGPRSMISLYTETFGGAGAGVAAPLEPYHWMLALLAAPEVKLFLEQ